MAAACELPIVLAPIAGFTNAAFRLIATRGGADMTYTEMVSAAGLAHGSVPTRYLLEVLPGEGPVICQLFGSNPDEMAFAAREVSGLGRFAEINLNAGCPVPRIMHEGAGAALVKSPERVHDLLAAMVAESSVPVTLKTRPGPRPDRVLMLELLDAAEKAGAKGITLHARFTSQRHSGEAHLDLLAELVRKARIPVTGNGGVKDAATARTMADTGVSAIMVGRAALADPCIFAKLKGGEGNSPPPDVSLFMTHVNALIALHSQISAHFPNDRILSVDDWVATIARIHLFRYFAGLRGAAELRRRLSTARSMDEVFKAVSAVSQSIK